MAVVSLKSPLSGHDRDSMIKIALKSLDSDVEIVSSEGETLLTNSFLLSQASPFLQSLLLPLLSTENSTIARIHFPDISKRSLSHLLNILKQGFSTGPAAGTSVGEEVHEAARALGIVKLSVLSTTTSNNEYFEKTEDNYEKMMQDEMQEYIEKTDDNYEKVMQDEMQGYFKKTDKNYEKKMRGELYCLLCQTYGHTFSKACIVNVRCLACYVKGHVKRDCKQQKYELKGKAKKEYGDCKEENYELKNIKGEIKREYGDCKKEKCNVKDIKLEDKKERICEEGYVEIEVAKDEQDGEDIANDEMENLENSNKTPAMEVDYPAPLPLVGQESDQSSNSYSPLRGQAGPAETKRKLPNRKGKGLNSSNFKNTENDSPEIINGKKSSSKFQNISEYRCTKCDFKAKYLSRLNQHVKSVHEGVRYPCSKCDYKAKYLRLLNRHVNEVHKGIKYPCIKCEYKATSLSNLNNHIMSVHEGVKYACGIKRARKKRKLDVKRARKKRKLDFEDKDMQPMAPTTDVLLSDSSRSCDGGKPQPKRRVRDKKKAQVDNDLGDSFVDNKFKESVDNTDDDLDYDPEL